MQCNGKCQLMKKLEEQEKREQQKAPEMKLAAKLEILPSKNLYGTIDTPYQINSSFQYFISNEGSPIDQPSSIFHPPGRLIQN